MKINPDAPAFPCSEDNDYRGGDNGMTIRTWLVGQTMNGMCFDIENDDLNVVARNAVRIADAVVAALNAEAVPTETIPVLG